MDSDLKIGQLRRILALADDDATIPEALSALADADRQEAVDLEHNARQAAYFRYLETRREREHEAVQGTYDAVKEKTEGQP